MTEAAIRRAGDPATASEGPVRSFKQLRVYEGAFEAAMRVFEPSKAFPPDERYSLTDQIRRSSRAICANIAEGCSKRRYPAHFASKLSDAHAEAEETRVWLEFAARCGYLSTDVGRELGDRYDKIASQLVLMLSRPAQWQAS